MITHIVCWKYKPETTEEQKNEHRSALRALPAIIPNIESFEVGEDIMRLERSFDTALLAVYRDRAALEEYSVHPEHQKVVDFGRMIAERAISVDFESESK